MVYAQILFYFFNGRICAYYFLRYVYNAILKAKQKEAIKIKVLKHFVSLTEKWNCICSEINILKPFYFLGKKKILVISDADLFKFFIFYVVYHDGGPACGEIKTI